MDKVKNKFEEKEEKKPIIIRNSTDLQRLRLEKLMKNPDKPVIIPEKPKERGGPAVPDFVRNVMGSSAGAGSGEFHVYRHLRRKEYARQKYMKEKAEKEKMEEEYHNKLEENKTKAEERTAKKRMKRLKRKQKLKNVKRKNIGTKKESSSSEESDTDEEESSENVITIGEEKNVEEPINEHQVQAETNENCINKTEEVVDGKESPISEYQGTKIETSRTIINESQVDISKNIESESNKT